MVLFVTDRKIPVGRWLEAKPLIWIGERSYEIYLWQYPVIFLFAAKKWNEIPGAPILEAALIVLLAVWLHYLTGLLTKGNIMDFLCKPSSLEQGAVQAGIALSLLMLVIGTVGVGSAGSEKFPAANELAARLEENQRMLQQTQNGTGEEAVTAETVEETETAEVVQTPAVQPVYADPNLTNSAKVSTSQVLMIGDSIMLDSSPELKKQLPDCYIDAMQNRRVIQALDVGQQMIDEGHLHQTVVISLGTNVPISRDTATRIMNLFGSDISVFWVNLFGKTVTWQDEANQLLLDLTQTFPNLTVIDWKSVISEHPEWMWQDGDHPNLEGSAVYAQLIRESLEVVAAKQNAQ